MLTPATSTSWLSSGMTRDRVRYPCAMVPPNGPAAALSRSTWIHWWSPVASAKALTGSWVISSQPVCPRSAPASALSSSRPLAVVVMRSSLWCRRRRSAPQPQPALAALAHFRVERDPQQRPVRLQQPRVDEARHVVAPSLGEHDAVQAAAQAVVGQVELAQPRPGQVPRQDDDPLLGPVQLVQAGRQAPGRAGPPGPEQIRQGHVPIITQRPGGPAADSRPAPAGRVRLGAWPVPGNRPGGGSSSPPGGWAGTCW